MVMSDGDEVVTRREPGKMFLVLDNLTDLTKMRNIMPASAPTPTDESAALLKGLGERIRARRKQLRISSTTTAASAGMSRVTLHRIEQGEPSVSMGAYLNVVTALGLTLDIPDPETRKDNAADLLPQAIRLADYPQLAGLAWQLKGVDEIPPREALALYERNWRHVDTGTLSLAERDLIRRLTRVLGQGVLLV